MSAHLAEFEHLLQNPRTRALATDLLSMCLDIAGVVDPTPISDGAGTVFALVRGQWFDAFISGVSMFPYIGDLAKAGKFPKYLKTIEEAINMARESKAVADALKPIMVRLDRLLSALPGHNVDVARLRAKVAEFLTENRVAKSAAKILPDISGHFHYRQFTHNGNTIKEATGRLGVPGHVHQHRSRSAQRGVSGGTGDDAGHLIGNRFGASGRAENLSQQNWIQNQGGGTFHDLENAWEESLHQGVGIEVRVQDVLRKGESRPFMRRVQWVEVDTAGHMSRHELIFANPHSVKSRLQQNIPGNEFPPGHVADIVDLNAYRARQGK